MSCKHLKKKNKKKNILGGGTQAPGLTKTTLTNTYALQLNDKEVQHLNQFTRMSTTQAPWLLSKN